MSQIDELAERIERLLLRHAELQRTNALLDQERLALMAERDALKGRLVAARARVESLLTRLPDGPGTRPRDDAAVDGTAPPTPAQDTP